MSDGRPEAFRTAVGTAAQHLIAESLAGLFHAETLLRNYPGSHLQKQRVR